LLSGPLGGKLGLQLFDYFGKFGGAFGQMSEAPRPINVLLGGRFRHHRQHAFADKLVALDAGKSAGLPVSVHTASFADWAPAIGAFGFVSQFPIASHRGASISAERTHPTPKIRQKFGKNDGWARYIAA
jgi:hypothetical protein